MNNSADAEGLPLAFCWTRFGTEAGEPIERIIERKETERCSNDGTFLWGIGNSIAPAIAELIRREAAPEILFSPIKSRPRKVDVTPSYVVRWTAGEDLRGVTAELPTAIQVTSRWDPGRPGSAHYALVCASSQPLRLGDLGRLSFGALRNIRTGAPLGASQVTAVVERDAGVVSDSGEYTVALRAALIAPYFVRLRHPTDLAGGPVLLSRSADPLQLRL